MDIFHFKCTSCDKLMGATRESAGTQVRCPHCQQVMTVPSNESPTPPPAEQSPVTINEPLVPEPKLFQENTPSLSQETLPSIGPTVEIPSPIPAEPNPLQEIAPTREMTEISASFPSEEPPTTETPMPLGTDLQPQPTTEQEPGFFSNSSESQQTENMEGSPFDKAPSPTAEEAKKRPASGTSMAMMVLFFSLVSYSVLASVLLIVLFFRLSAAPKHPLEFIPDVDGDNPGAKRTKIRFNNDKERTQLKLPSNLVTKLGQSVEVGELQVTPVSIERKRVSVLVTGYEKPEPCKEDSLVLTLKLKNISKDQSFSPMDHYFNRFWRTGKTNSVPPPFTMVQLGNGKTTKSFFGGPAKWVPAAISGSKTSSQLRETVQGCNLDKVLEPGEETIAFLSTDGEDPATAELFKHQGPMLWRVQVRRGLVQVGSREIPSSAVLGVEFSNKDISTGKDSNS